MHRPSVDDAVVEVPRLWRRSWLQEVPQFRTSLIIVATAVALQRLDVLRFNVNVCVDCNCAHFE